MSPVFAVVGLIAALAGMMLRSRPAGVLAVYIVLIAFVPYWVGLQIGPQFMPLSFGVALWAAVVAFDARGRVTGVDWLLLAFAASLVAGTLIGVIEISHSLAVIGGWLAPYIAGRHLSARVERATVNSAITWMAVLLAAVAVVEFAADWHPFVNLTWQGGPADIWRGIQYRSAFPRSEGAMGHSIALGGAIAIGVPFVLLAPWKLRWRVLAFALLGLGVAVTFSRNALIAVFAAAALTALFGHRRRLSRAARQWIVAALAAVAIVGVPVYLRVIDGGTGVLAASTGYRANYVSLISSVEWFGLATSYVEYSSGRFGWASELYAGGVVVTLDNTILLTALQFGWIPMGLLVGVLGWLGVKLVTGKVGDPALISACGQFFTIATVAMITQYPYLLWFVIGIAVTRVYKFAEGEEDASAPAADVDAGVGRRAHSPVARPMAGR